MNKQKQCPNCLCFKLIGGATKIVYTAFSLWAIGGLFMILFFPIGILLFVAGLFTLIVGIFSYANPKIRKSYSCSECKWEGELGSE